MATHVLAWVQQDLHRLGLSPPEKQRPPPEVRYVPLDEEGRELAALAETFDSP